MSLVVAIKDKNRIVIGSDKQGSNAGNKDHTCTKIWEVEELPGAIMGGVGSARATQVIQYTQLLDKNSIPLEITTEYIVQYLAPTLMDVLKANKILPIESEDAGCPILPNSFIFAYQDNAWIIWNDLSVIEISDYFAIGSGADVARGVLFATKDKNPFDRIVTSIDAAAESTLFVDHGVDLLATSLSKADVKLIKKALRIEEVKE